MEYLALFFKIKRGENAYISANKEIFHISSNGLIYILNSDIFEVGRCVLNNCLEITITLLQCLHYNKTSTFLLITQSQFKELTNHILVLLNS
jgi:hypothetical protein